MILSQSKAFLARILFIFCIGLVLLSCQESFDEPEISLDEYVLEKGFELELIAAEPILRAPVAIDFDNQGRIWVAEMPGYMHNMDGKGENEPNGRIKILQDLDKDGKIDHAKIFLDSLVLPRAIALVYDGLLYAEPPNLWFVTINDDTPGNRTLVDSLYATEGNPEHQPNGLQMNIDNWIYNAKSSYRYQRKHGVWKKEPTTFRGQWGISQDNFGRLYYNDNSRQLLGDHLLPNQLIKNKFFIPKYGVNQLLTDDQRVYPLQPTLVNRGYATGVLDADSLLVNVTAACSPLVYRGGKFPENYNENVFVCVPEANLIKRNVLSFEGNKTIARQAWEGKEFLTSADMGFRPVSLKNGPDGSLYIVDMHLGVFGHHAYLSPYLKKLAKERQYDTIVDMGRILKVNHKSKPQIPLPDFNAMSDQALVGLLKSKNGWIRDMVQQMLLYRQDDGSIPNLKKLARDINDPIAQLHALYVLKDLNALDFELLASCASGQNPEVVAHALILLEAFATIENITAFEQLLDTLSARNNLMIDSYIALGLGNWLELAVDDFLPRLARIADRHKSDAIVKEAIISGARGTMDLLRQYMQKNMAHDTILVSAVETTVENELNKIENPIYSKKLLTEDKRTRGAKTFRQICAACHGINGMGIEGLAPPLMHSEYMDGPVERLALIILHGLQGPVSIGDEQKTFSTAMPGLNSNGGLTDEEIAGVIAYVTSAFSDVPRGLKAEQVKPLREVKSRTGGEFTEQELRAYLE